MSGRGLRQAGRRKEGVGMRAGLCGKRRLAGSCGPRGEWVASYLALPVLHGDFGPRENIKDFGP